MANIGKEIFPMKLVFEAQKFFKDGLILFKRK
jgi:hypothetical protein